VKGRGAVKVSGKKVGDRSTARKVPITVKVAPDLKLRIERAAAASTRSVSAEVETALERATVGQEFLGGASVQRVLDKVALAFAHEGQRAADLKRKRAGSDWTADPDCYVAAMLGAVETLLLSQPDPKQGSLSEHIKLQIESLEGRMATYFWKEGRK
jgi:hypothetical protein